MDACIPPEYHLPVFDPLEGPNSTVLVTEGHLHERAQRLLPLTGGSREIPENTALLEATFSPTGTATAMRLLVERTGSLYPMIRPGAIITVDTHQRAIASPKEWTNEFDRPIYLLYHAEWLCLRLVPIDGRWNPAQCCLPSHGQVGCIPLPYGKDVEVDRTSRRSRNEPPTVNNADNEPLRLFSEPRSQARQQWSLKYLGSSAHSSAGKALQSLLHKVISNGGILGIGTDVKFKATLLGRHF